MSLSFRSLSALDLVTNTLSNMMLFTIDDVFKFKDRAPGRFHVNVKLHQNDEMTIFITVENISCQEKQNRKVFERQDLQCTHGLVFRLIY